MTRLLLIFSLFLSSNSFAQIDSTLRESFNQLFYSPEYLNLKYDSFSIRIDSIDVIVKYNSKEIVADNFFTKSTRSLSVRYYFKNDSLFYVSTSEICTVKPELTCKSGYYIVSNKINQEEHSSMKVASHGVVSSMEEIIKMHYCPTRFDNLFLEKYIWTLLEAIKTRLFWLY